MLTDADIAVKLLLLGRTRVPDGIVGDGDTAVGSVTVSKNSDKGCSFFFSSNG